MIEKENHGPQFGYHLIDGYILTPLGIGDQYTCFEIDDVYGDWTLDGKEYYLNIKDLLPILNENTGFYRVELSDIAWKGFDLDMSLRADIVFVVMEIDLEIVILQYLEYYWKVLKILEEENIDVLMVNIGFML